MTPPFNDSMNLLMDGQNHPTEGLSGHTPEETNLHVLESDDKRTRNVTLMEQVCVEQSISLFRTPSERELASCMLVMMEDATWLDVHHSNKQSAQSSTKSSKGRSELEGRLREMGDEERDGPAQQDEQNENNSTSTLLGAPGAESLGSDNLFNINELVQGGTPVAAQGSAALAIRCIRSRTQGFKRSHGNGELKPHSQSFDDIAVWDDAGTRKRRFDQGFDVFVPDIPDFATWGNVEARKRKAFSLDI